MLRVEHLSLPNKKKISITLNESDCLHLIGPNGCGKSLILQSLAALHPMHFNVFKFNQASLTSLKFNYFRTQVIYLPPHVSGFRDRGEDYWRLPFKFKINQGRTQDDSYLVYAQKFKLLDRDFFKLSSGEKALLTLLRALSMSPQILLLDEVFSYLDTDKLHLVETLILDWFRQGKKGLVIVDHHHEFSNLKLRKVHFDDLLENT